MLTAGQKNYLEKLTPEQAGRVINVHPYNPRTKELADGIIEGIKRHIPEADVRYMGASALGISGQNDVDIYIICPAYLRDTYSSKLNYASLERLRNKWKGVEDEIEISIYLSDPEDPKFQEQLEIFKTFQENPKILKEYEELKRSMSGKIYSEYQTAKYEFYNKVLGVV